MHGIRALVVAFVVLGAALGVSNANGAGARSHVEWQFHSVIPLGFEPFLLQPAHLPFTLIASAENPQFEGLRRVATAEGERLVSGEGKTLEAYPRTVTF